MADNPVEETAPSSVDDVMTSIGGVRDALTVRRVFGEAYEIGDTTVIPVARVAGGAGGGGGESTGDDPGGGAGGGFGMGAQPVGVYQVRDGEVTWKPAVDVSRLARRGQVLAGIAMVCVTLVMLGRRR